MAVDLSKAGALAQQPQHAVHVVHQRTREELHTVVEEQRRQRRTGAKEQNVGVRPAERHQSLEGAVDQRRAGDGHHICLGNDLRRGFGRQISWPWAQFQHP